MTSLEDLADLLCTRGEWLTEVDQVDQFVFETVLVLKVGILDNLVRLGCSVGSYYMEEGNWRNVDLNLNSASDVHFAPFVRGNFVAGCSNSRQVVVDGEGVILDFAVF